MNKRLFNGIRTYSGNKIVPFILCTAFFLGGSIAGVFFSGGITAEDPAVSYILRFSSTQLFSQTDLPGYWMILLSEIKFPLMAFLFGFSALGIIFLPVLSTLRGFLLTFSISVITRTLGLEDGVSVLCVLAVGAAVTTPCFFILSTQSLDASRHLLSYALPMGANDLHTPYSAKYFKCALICFGILLLWVLVKKYLLFTLFM